MTRNFEILHHPQGSDEWKLARLGLLTGSAASDALKLNAKGQFYATRKDLALRLLCERLTGAPQNDVFVTADMCRGTEQEPYARMAYEGKTGHIVRETGFLRHRQHKVGASLDGDIDDFDGIVEFKNPKSTTHLATLEAGEVPENNLLQVHFNLWVSGAQWCDFVSYDSRMPEHLQLFIKRVQASDVDFVKLEAAVLQFLAELDALERKWMQQP